MLLVDTSVWVNHFRHGDPQLAQSLEDGLVLMHPFILGEIACGNLQKRTQVLSDLQTLPLATSAENSEALLLAERHKLYGSGLSWIDVHLLASALLSHCRLWTLDARLARAATHLRLRYSG